MLKQVSFFLKKTYCRIIEIYEQIAQGVYASRKRCDYYSSEVTVTSEL